MGKWSGWHCQNDKKATSRLTVTAMRALIASPPKGRRPDSGDPMVVVPLDLDGKPTQSGGWKDTISDENFAALVSCWRMQDVNADTTAP